MAIVVDLDDLVLNTDIVINETASPPTIQLIPDVGLVLKGTSSGLQGSETGVTGQALYSFLKNQWKDNATYIKYPFPMEAITPEQFEFINDWEPADDITRKLIRTAGWTERSAAGAIKRQYIGVVSLGSLGANDTPYYELVDNGTSAGAVDFTYPGRVNEAVQIFGDATNGNIDYTAAADEFNIFAREQGKTYAASNNTAIGATDGLTYITYRFPLSNATDLKISASDAAITKSETITNATWLSDIATYTANAHGYSDGDYVFVTGVTPSGFNTSGVVQNATLNTFDLSLTPDPGAYVSGGAAASIYSGITVDYLSPADNTNYDVDEDGTPETYSIVIQDSSGAATNQQIYEKIQYLLRQNVDINNAGTDTASRIGKLEETLLAFVGDTLRTAPNVADTSKGVVINNLASVNKASIEVYNDGNTFKVYPRISSGQITFGQYAGSGVFKYFMFFSTNYGSATAELVNNDSINGGAAISGTYTGSAVNFDFAYSKSTQDGRAGNGTDGDAAITLVGIGLDTGQFISVEYSIAEGSGNTFLLAPPQERNYSNPV